MLSRVVNGVQQIKTHVTFHTDGQLILWPYGYTKTDIPSDMTADDHATFVAMGKAMAKTNGYKPEQSSDLYITDGDEIDWMYGVEHIFSFTFELYPSAGADSAPVYSPGERDRAADRPQPRGDPVPHQRGGLSVRGDRQGRPVLPVGANRNGPPGGQEFRLRDPPASRRRSSRRRMQSVQWRSVRRHRMSGRSVAGDGPKVTSDGSKVPLAPAAAITRRGCWAPSRRLELDHREDVAGGILEPRDRRRVGPGDASLVLAGALVAFEHDAGPGQAVHGGVDVGDREVQDRERGGLMVGLGIDDDPAAPSEVQGQHAVRLGHVKPERVGVEGLGLRDVVRGEAGEAVTVAEHGVPFQRLRQA